MRTATEFFEAFEQLNASQGGLLHDAFFAPTFMVAGDDGVRAVTPAQLAAVASQRRGLLDTLGRRSTELTHLEEHPIDAHYVMTVTEWRWHFEPEGKPSFDITLPATHILHHSTDGLRIVFYRSGEVMRVLKERGLIT
jgi:hypothetical protein